MKLLIVLLVGFFLIFIVSGFATEYLTIRQLSELEHCNDSIYQGQSSGVYFELLAKEKELIKVKNEILSIRKNSRQRTFFEFLLVFFFVSGLVFIRFRTKQKLDDTQRSQNSIIQAQQRELKLSFQNLQEAQAKLVQAEKMALVGQVASGITHEINNPMNFISGGIESLFYSLDNLLYLIRNPAKTAGVDVNEIEKEIKSLFNSITNGVHRITKIISSMRTISSPSDNSDFTFVRLEDCLEVALVILDSKIKYTNTTVKKNYSALPIVIYGNATQLGQVFLNVLDNAIQAMEGRRGEGVILIETFKSEENVVVSIADSGPGISAGIQEKIMEPFFTTKGTGTGLGLSISYTIVESHGGKLTCLSEEGKGAKFLIELKLSGS